MTCLAHCMRFSVLIAAIGAVISGCTFTSGDNGIPTGVSFRAGTVQSSASYATGAQHRPKTSTTEFPELSPQSTLVDESITTLASAYDALGNLVGSYTPTKFRLFIWTMGIYNPLPGGDGYELSAPIDQASVYNPEKNYADFINEVTIFGGEAVPAGEYSRLWFWFASSRNQVNSNSYEGYVQIEPSIEVTLPGYEGVFPDVPVNWLSGYRRKDLGGDRYHFDPAMLQQLRVSGEYVRPIEHFAYFGDGASYSAILPGVNGNPDGWDTDSTDTLATSFFSARNTMYSAIIVPSQTVYIPDDASEVIVRVIWDLDGIVEVYDSNTPADKSDDAVVLARNFWERFAYTIETVVR